MPRDTSRISITAHSTGYTWFANGLSPRPFATRPGVFFYHSQRPWMVLANRVLGISDLETGLLQRHLVLDHLLSAAIRDLGVSQVLEPACGLSPRGWRFMRRSLPEGFRYVEADLPGMAERKRGLLARTGDMPPGHVVADCDVFAGGELSLESVAGRHLAPGVPTAVVMEGLVNYFPTPVMTGVWGRVAGILSSLGGGLYLTDNLMHPNGHPMGFLIPAWLRLVAVVARGRMHTHFSGPEEARRTFASAGFSQTLVHAPEDFRGVLPLPQSRLASFVSVIEARVSG